MTALDHGVGEIVQALKRTNLYENSFILFSSDNGGSGRKFNTPLKGKKEQVLLDDRGQAINEPFQSISGLRGRTEGRGICEQSFIDNYRICA